MKRKPVRSPRTRVSATVVGCQYSASLTGDLSQNMRIDMTDQEIKSLARGYAEENYNTRGGVDIMADEAENVIRYIMRTHDIVKKQN